MIKPSLRKIALVVEDEPLFRMEVVDMLEGEGFRVIEASKASDGLKALEAGDPVTMVVTDVHLPGGMDGFALAREIARRWPTMPIVVVSAVRQPEDGDLPGRVAFVGRPFKPSHFLAALREADGRP